MPPVSPLYTVVGFIAFQRLAELAFARRNARALKARGGIEVGQRNYVLLVALHLVWLLALLGAVAPQTPISMPLLAGFILLQGARLWVIMTLGRRWTTRVIVLPGAERVRSGPYRFLDHPNYVIVSGEIALVPLMFGAWSIAVAAFVLNLLVLRNRIQTENAALAEAYGN